MPCKYLCTTCIFVFILILGESIAGNNVASDIPFHPKPEEHYLFYQHGKLIEQNGIPTSHIKHGSYDFHEILNTFSYRGFQVIAELRATNASIHGHAFRLARKINSLIDKGVAPNNITLVGLDKGGRIALVTSSYVGNSEINYVIINGCYSNDSKVRQFIKKHELKPAGRILDLRLEVNRKTGPCSAFYANQEEVVESRELIFSVNTESGLFFKAESKWIDPVVAWALEKPLNSEGLQNIIYKNNAAR